MQNANIPLNLIKQSLPHSMYDFNTTSVSEFVVNSIFFSISCFLISLKLYNSPLKIIVNLPSSVDIG